MASNTNRPLVEKVRKSESTPEVVGDGDALVVDAGVAEALDVAVCLQGRVGGVGFCSVDFGEGTKVIVQG